MNHRASTIDVSLTVVETPSNDGNAVGGAYKYVFNPDHVHVVERGTDIVYRLEGTDKDRFRMTDLYTTDARDQFEKPRITEDGHTLTVHHRNTHKQLTVVSVFVHDVKQGLAVPCDPQVSNDPPPQM